MNKFPAGFLWGGSTSSYQVEGQNLNSDWWEWEKRLNLKEKSGEACRHYQLFREDFDLARELNHNAHRLSIEWSRIEPEEGKFSQKEIEHYKEVITALLERGLVPLVTLHHFTNPLWFSKLGGWMSKDAIRYFLRYVEYVVDNLSFGVRYWITINEPLVYTYHAYILGVWPPQEKSFRKSRQVEKNLLRSHIGAYRLIHRIYKEKNISSVGVSIAKNLQAFMACRPSFRNALAVRIRDRRFNRWFLERLAQSGTLDFIGVNYYTRGLIETRGWLLRNLVLDVCEDKAHDTLKKNSLGWDIYPQGLYTLLLKLKKYKLPVIITENGICTDDDSLRWEFIREHLIQLAAARQQGLDIRGYMYWSLLDNYEWDKGFSPRFGIIEVDYKNYKRRVRESAKKFAVVAKTGVVD